MLFPFTIRAARVALLVSVLVAGAVGVGFAWQQAIPLLSAATISQENESVTIIDFSFQPQALTIPISTTVTWTNADSAPHTSTSSTGLWDSGTLTGADNSFTTTFTQTGTFNYICTIHPSMTGVVNVVEAQNDPAPFVFLPMVQR